MKRQDIQVGVEYAVQTGTLDSRWRVPSKMRVTGLPEKNSPWGNDYMVPAVLIYDGSEVERRRSPRDFKMPWADYLVLKAEKDAEYAARQAAAEGRQRERALTYEGIADVLDRANVLSSPYQRNNFERGDKTNPGFDVDALARIVSCARDGQLDYRTPITEEASE
jgi:hypothetical protein